MLELAHISKTIDIFLHDYLCKMQHTHYQHLTLNSISLPPGHDVSTQTKLVSLSTHSFVLVNAILLAMHNLSLRFAAEEEKQEYSINIHLDLTLS